MADIVKVGIIVYHKNARLLYRPEWIEQFTKSITGQDYPCTIYECCYGGMKEQLIENSVFTYEVLPTFVDAMNLLMDRAFNDGCNAVANTNVDDYYTLDRITRQVGYIKAGFDLIASNFYLLQNNRPHHLHRFSNLNLKQEIGRGHNIIGHPVVMYSRNFWKKHRYNPDEIPREDLLLWQRAIKDMKMVVLPFALMYHRVHGNAVSQPNQLKAIR